MKALTTQVLCSSMTSWWLTACTTSTWVRHRLSVDQCFIQVVFLLVFLSSIAPPCVFSAHWPVSLYKIFWPCVGCITRFSVLCSETELALSSGYVQGMSDLLSPILYVMENEVDAFWCFVSFMDQMVSSDVATCLGAHYESNNQQMCLVFFASFLWCTLCWKLSVFEINYVA